MLPNSPSSPKATNTPCPEPPRKRPRRSAHDPLDGFKRIYPNSDEARECDNSKMPFLLQSYEAEGQIGRGSYGDVLCVTSKKTGKKFAIKIGKKELNSLNYNEKLREVTFHQEIPEHDNIIRLVEAWSENRLLFVVTELCVTDLANFKHSSDFTTPLLFHAVHDVISGVHHLHSNGVLHVDLKPANIFVTEKGVCKIGDFGLVTKIGEQRYVDGDGRYLPKDLLNGVPSTKTDIYSLSMTILEVSLGIDIPTIEEREELLSSETLNAKLKLLGREELFDIIQPGLSSEPSKRPEASDMLLRVKTVVFRNGPRPDITLSREAMKPACNVIDDLLLRIRGSEVMGTREIMSTPDNDTSPKSRTASDSRLRPGSRLRSHFIHRRKNSG
uniref:non-specific serine/threonine protein kinase n=1 Tax=Steinernema glaseri TaxID=37863 RepID=A0A1I7ZVQ8_9BILA